MLIKMKKHRITFYLALSVLAIILISQFYFFPLTEKNLNNDAMVLISADSKSAILVNDVLDLEKSNNNITSIYHVTLSTGEQKYYVVSYCKSLIIPRYERASYLELYSGKAAELRAPGFPRDINYSIYNNALIPYGYQLNTSVRNLWFFGFLLLAYVIRKVLNKINR